MPSLIDLSHAVEHGMVTYRGLPAPMICDYWSRETSAAHYGPGVSFHIGRIDMVANTGTYLDSPFHRYAEGKDLSELPLASVAGLETVVVRASAERGRSIDASAFSDLEVAGKAVLVHTGWSRHWGGERYFDGHPFLTDGAARWLREAGVRLVGIDSLNIDDTDDDRRPVHSHLLGHDIPICEHMTNLESLPDTGAVFHAAPVKVRAMGTFPVRAYCACGAISGP